MTATTRVCAAEDCECIIAILPKHPTHVMCQFHRFAKREGKPVEVLEGRRDMRTRTDREAK